MIGLTGKWHAVTLANMILASSLIGLIIFFKYLSLKRNMLNTYLYFNVVL